MDCNNNQRNIEPRRGQMMPNQSMKVDCSCDCSCGVPPTTIPPIMPRSQGCQNMNMPNMNQMPTRPAMPMRPPTSPRNCMSMRPPVQPVQPMDQGSVAMAYVPCQKWGQIYSFEQALNRGTIFPELDLPFNMGRCQ